MRREKLTSEEITDQLEKLKGWETNGEMISRRFEFKDFAASLAFVNAVAAIAEQADHHPDTTFGWGYAEIAFTTHDRGGVTDIDIATARMIDEL